MKRKHRTPQRPAGAPTVHLTIIVGRSPLRRMDRMLQVWDTFMSLDDPGCGFTDTPDIRAQLAKGEHVTKSEVKCGVQIETAIEMA